MESLKIGNLTVNLSLKIAFVNAEQVLLTSQEFAILAFLVVNHGTVKTDAEILAHVCGAIVPDADLVKVQICKIRRKIAKLNNGLHYIETAWGKGYVARSPELSATIAPSERRRPRSAMAAKFGIEQHESVRLLGNAVEFMAKNANSNESELVQFAQDCARFAKVWSAAITENARRDVKASATQLIERALFLGNSAFLSLGLAFRHCAENEYKPAQKAMLQAYKLKRAA